MPLCYTARARVREKAMTSSPSSFRGSYLVNQAKFSSAVIATTIFTTKANRTQNIIFDHTLPLIPEQFRMSYISCSISSILDYITEALEWHPPSFALLLSSQCGLVLWTRLGLQLAVPGSNRSHAGAGSGPSWLVSWLNYWVSNWQMLSSISTGVFSVRYKFD